jgi:hypothetical protein
MIKPMTNKELLAMRDQELDETHPPISVMGKQYKASEVLKQVDANRYSVFFHKWLQIQLKNEILLCINNKYYIRGR